jgi:hypothetical protein
VTTTSARDGRLPAEPRAVAAHYLDLGYIPIPIPRTGRCKAPTLDRWQDLRPSPQDLNSLFPTGQALNVGLLLGEPSGGLIDIDLDAAAAVAAGPILLPSTGWVSGRASKPRSHWWYRVQSPPDKGQEKFTDLDGTDLLEIRSTGAQTVAPPGIHESGERIVWDTFAQPAVVELPELLVAVSSVAAVALLARHWPTRGARQDAFLALAGALLRASWNGQSVERFVQALAVVTGDEEVRKRVQAVAQTASKLEQEKPTSSWRKLEGLIDPAGKDVLQRVRDWLGLSVPARLADVTVEATPWPGPPAEEAFHGLVGRVIGCLEPSTEADPAALLVQALVSFGNIIGRSAHFTVEGDCHYGNQFCVLVGRTSKGRKGTSWSRIRQLFEAVDRDWAEKRVLSGLSSSEGLIWNVRDPVTAREKIKERGHVTGVQEYEADPGEPDKRILIQEPEFANVLKQIERKGNTLSALLRQAWERGNLRTLVSGRQHAPVKATNAHVSMVGHITAEELRRYLTLTETANGFGNRPLWVCADRSKCLPEGGQVDLELWEALRGELIEAVAFGKAIREVRRDEEARVLWHQVYSDLSEGKPGLAGALLARAEAHVMRLAMLYALLDKSPAIQAPHLMAALALWEYCERSVYFVFGDHLGDPVADELLRLLRGCPNGLTRTDISSYFQRNVPADRIGRAWGVLLQNHLARREAEQTEGRPSERWFAVGKTAK